MLRSSYYVLKMLPHFLWLPVQTRSSLGHVRDAFLDQLVQDGLDTQVAHELAEAYDEANRQLIREMTSPRTWMKNQE
jgi:hypothetical protein